MKDSLKYILSFAWGHFGRNLGLLLYNKNMREKNTDMSNGVHFMKEPFFLYFVFEIVCTLFLISCLCV